MTSTVPYNIKTLKSHIEITLHPAIVDGSWSEIERFGDAVVEELNSRKSPLCIIDLTPLNYMGSSVVALLVRIWKAVKTGKGEMVVVTESAFVKEIIVLAGLDKIWTIVPHLNGACQVLGVPLPGTPPKSWNQVFTRRKLLVVCHSLI